MSRKLRNWSRSEGKRRATLTKEGCRTYGLGRLLPQPRANGRSCVKPAAGRSCRCRRGWLLLGSCCVCMEALPLLVLHGQQVEEEEAECSHRYSAMARTAVLPSWLPSPAGCTAHSCWRRRGGAQRLCRTCAPEPQGRGQQDALHQLRPAAGVARTCHAIGAQEPYLWVLLADNKEPPAPLNDAARLAELLNRRPHLHAAARLLLDTPTGLHGQSCKWMRATPARARAGRRWRQAAEPKACGRGALCAFARCNMLSSQNLAVSRTDRHLAAT